MKFKMEGRLVQVARSQRAIGGKGKAITGIEARIRNPV